MGLVRKGRSTTRRRFPIEYAAAGKSGVGYTVCSLHSDDRFLYHGMVDTARFLAACFRFLHFLTLSPPNSKVVWLPTFLVSRFNATLSKSAAFSVAPYALMFFTAGRNALLGGVLVERGMECVVGRRSV